MTRANQIVIDSFAVLLPAFSELSLSSQISDFLANGGCSILLAETREEYVRREMSQERKMNETHESVKSLIDQARRIQPDLIVAIDQEIIGINRLHKLSSNTPDKNDLKHIQTSELELICASVAQDARELGVNCFLAPTLDIVLGENPWLSKRTWTTDKDEMVKIATAFIKGVQSSKVIATAKHYPGFSNIALDPAIEVNAIMKAPLSHILDNSFPFKKASECGVELIMVGPAIVEQIDDMNPALYSPVIIRKLRDEIGFRGIVLSDDLDAKATMQNYAIEEVAIKALKAGCNYLLLADLGDHLGRVAREIQNTMNQDVDFYNHVSESANKIRTLARKYA